MERKMTYKNIAYALAAAEYTKHRGPIEAALSDNPYVIQRDVAHAAEVAWMAGYIQGMGDGIEKIAAAQDKKLFTDME